MTNKYTKGYTKSRLGQMSFEELNAVLKNPQSYNPIFKDPKEPLDKWIIRKTEEQIYGGTDEQGMNRNEDVQNPNPPFCNSLTTTIYKESGEPFEFTFQYRIWERSSPVLVTVKRPLFLDGSFGTGWVDDLVQALDAEIGKDYELKIIE